MQALLCTNLNDRYQTPTQVLADLNALQPELRQLNANAQAQQNLAGYIADDVLPGDDTATALTGGDTTGEDSGNFRTGDLKPSSPTILCVENRPKHQDSLRIYFTKHGFRVLLLTDPQRAMLRLASDHGYQDVFEDGYDILDENWEADPDNQLTLQSVIVYRYYDEASTLLGRGQTPSMATFATDLGSLIVRVRDLVCGNPKNKLAANEFRCYLVAHSMGGLVCRAFLQNPKYDPANARRHVAKLFTYATPHNGIDVGGFNVPAWLTRYDVSNFSREHMAKYLDLEEAFQATGRVDWLPEDRFPSEQVFTMIGTNRQDYEVAAGLSRSFAGHGSDGLVRIENATLCGIDTDGNATQQCAKAFAYRAHSGFFGIVNSEEAYQNMTRFLFGDVRVDIWVHIDEIRLPPEIQERVEAGQTLNALYQVEALASARGKLWFLTRRVAEEDSVACLSWADWQADPKENGALYLSTVFLSKKARVNPRRRTLSYSLQLGVRVPDYELDKRFWPDKHYEGGYLFRDAIIIELTPPTDDKGAWKVLHAWQRQGFSTADQDTELHDVAGGKDEAVLEFDSETTPGIKGRVRFVLSSWD